MAGHNRRIAKAEYSPFFTTDTRSPSRSISATTSSKHFVTSPSSPFSSLPYISKSIIQGLGQASSDDGKPSMIDHFRSCDVFQAIYKSHEDRSEDTRITSSVRHLCPHECYLTAFAPVREWNYLRKAISECSDDPPDSLLKHWHCKLLLRPSSRPNVQVAFCSPDGDVLTSKVAVLRKLGLFHGKYVFRNRMGTDSPGMRRGRKRKLEFVKDMSTLETMASSVADTETTTIDSPFGLLEELFHDNPWRLLLSTVLLNRTTRQQVDAVMSEFLTKWPTPESVVTTPADEISIVIRPLGMCHRRASGLIRFSQDYLQLIQRKSDANAWTRQDVGSLLWRLRMRCISNFCPKEHSDACNRSCLTRLHRIQKRCASVREKISHAYENQHLS